MKTENYQSEEREIHGVKVIVASYKIGERFYCHVSNRDPGGRIARVEAASLNEAKEIALSAAAEKLRSVKRDA